MKVAQEQGQLAHENKAEFQSEENTFINECNGKPGDEGTGDGRCGRSNSKDAGEQWRKMVERWNSEDGREKKWCMMAYFLILTSSHSSELYMHISFSSAMYNMCFNRLVKLCFLIQFGTLRIIEHHIYIMYGTIDKVITYNIMHRINCWKHCGICSVV